MSLSLFRKALNSVRRHDTRLANRAGRIEALLGDGAGTVEVSGKPGWVYVRVEGDADSVTEVQCNRVDIPWVEDVRVVLERTVQHGLGPYQIVGTSNPYDNNTIGPGGDGAIMVPHASQHERRDGGLGGYDPVDVYGRMLVPLRVRPSSPAAMTLEIATGYNPLTRNWYAGGTSPTFVAPTGDMLNPGQRYDLLCLDDTDTPRILQGTPLNGAGTPTVPALPRNLAPLAIVYLAHTTTTLIEANIVRDARFIVSATTPFDVLTRIVCTNSQVAVSNGEVVYLG